MEPVESIPRLQSLLLKAAHQCLALNGRHLQRGRPAKILNVHRTASSHIFQISEWVKSITRQR
jgi:hypothetical protein